MGDGLVSVWSFTCGAGFWSLVHCSVRLSNIALDGPSEYSSLWCKGNQAHPSS